MRNISRSKINPASLVTTAALLLLVSATLAACSHTKQRRFDYMDEKGGFRVAPLPDDWRPFEKECSDISYLQSDRQTAISANITCGDYGKDVGIEDISSYNLYGVDESKIIEQDYIELDGKKFLHRKLEAKQFGIPLILEIYLTRVDDCIYDMQFVAYEKSYEANKKYFDKLVKGFKFIKE